MHIPFQFFSGSFLGVMLWLSLFSACNHQSEKSSVPTQNEREYKAVQVHYAQGFSIDEYADYSVINIFNSFQDQSDSLRYVLVPRGKESPDGFKNAQVIKTPVRSLIATSTTHIALTEMLNANEVIKGMVGAQYAYNSEIRRGFEEGKITAFTQGEFNNEVALDMNPDLVMISAGQASQYDNYRLLVDSGIAVFVNAEWLETTPLGKAEWVKVMGLLLEKEELAEKQFKKVAERYNALKARADKSSEKPLVINNMPYKGAWFVSGGNSFTAQYLKDAAADYPWYDNKSTGGLRLNFETVYEAGLRAEVWLNPGTAITKKDILAVDPRFKDFKSLETGRIYNNNKRMSPSGGNDFWETGVVRPDLILSDLITILHPGTLENNSLYFYQKVE